MLVSLVAGAVYAAVQGLSSSAVTENETVLAAVGVFPGSRTLGRTSETFSGGLPLPKGVVTTEGFQPPSGADQGHVVSFYLDRLRPHWQPRIERSLAGTAGTSQQRSYRITFARAGRCVVLATAGMVGGVEPPVYTLSTYKSDDC